MVANNSMDHIQIMMGDLLRVQVSPQHLYLQREDILAAHSLLHPENLIRAKLCLVNNKKSKSLTLSSPCANS